MKSLINLKNIGSTFGLRGEISPISPPQQVRILSEPPIM